MKKPALLLSSLAAIALLGAGCAPSYNAPAPAPGANAPANLPAPVSAVPPAPGRQTSAKVDVSIQNFAFSPADVTISKGMTVVWTNNDAVGHTITADSGSGLSSQLLNPGDTYAYTFNDTGTFSYHCSIHKTMQGTVTVR